MVAFFLTESLSSPLLILAAAGTGVLTVVFVELLQTDETGQGGCCDRLDLPCAFQYRCDSDLSVRRERSLGYGCGPAR